MHRRSPAHATGHARATIRRSVGLVVLLTAAAPGCGGPGSPATRTRVVACGTAKTAAEVPVKVLVAQGNVACGTAKAVMLAYARAIRSGRAPGNGGGGPVKIKGWTCQGFATPVVLQTGKAAKCKRGDVEILEILPPPPSPSAS
ncbi:MAG: hypothetical protein ACTHJW_19330 [Streptosporangiaceae bacterium]